METKECNCSFCKLREITNKQAVEELKWLQERKNKLIKDNQEKNIELIELCVKKLEKKVVAHQI